MSQTTASLVSFDTGKIKKVLNTSIKELSSTGEYDYLPVPDFKVISPKGGQRLYLDTPIEIQWYIEFTDKVSDVQISYDKDLQGDESPQNWYTIAKNVDILNSGSRGESGSYYWDATNWIDIDSEKGPFRTRPTPSNNYRIQISSSAYPGSSSIAIYAVSDNVFTITTRSINIIPINANNVVANKGNLIPVQWESDGASDFVGIQLMDASTTSSMPIRQIEEKYYVGRIESYNWRADDIPPTLYTASIKIYDYERPDAVWDISNTFDVTVNYVTIASTDGLEPSILTPIIYGFYGEPPTSSLSGIRPAEPYINSASLHGIYRYLDRQIALLDDIGTGYYPRSYITAVEGQSIIGKPYAKTYLTMVNVDSIGIKYPTGGTGGNGTSADRD